MPQDSKEQDEFEKRIIGNVVIAVGQSIKANVNGGIIELRKSFEDYKEEDIAWKAVDEAWKNNATPSIDAMSAAIGFGKTAMWVLGILALIATILGGVIALVPYIVPHKV